MLEYVLGARKDSVNLDRDQQSEVLAHTDYFYRLLNWSKQQETYAEHVSTIQHNKSTRKLQFTILGRGFLIGVGLLSICLLL